MTNFHDRFVKDISWYKKWHDNDFHLTLHWFALIALCLIITFYAVSIIEDESNLASAVAFTEIGDNEPDVPTPTIAELNQKLINLSRQYRRVGGTEKTILLEELKSLAQSRSELLLQTIQTAPGEVLRNNINRSFISHLPGEVQNLFEKRGKVRGKFEYQHIHYGEFDSGTTEDLFYIIENGTNKKYKVTFTGDDIDALTDDIVSLEGVLLNDQIVANPGDLVVESAEAVTQSTRKVIVLLVNFSTKNLTLNPSTIRQNVYDVADNYFRENSFNKWGLVGKFTEDGSGDVFGPYTIAYDGVGCDTSTIRTQAKNAATSAGINISGYDNFVYFFPNTNCGFSGSATVGGNPAYVNMNGSISQGTITHELGHNMGAHHASSWSCTESGTRVSISLDANCTLGEYGDPYDVMGTSGGMKHFNNYHKGITLNSLNWLIPQNTFTIDRNISPDGTYTIEPIESVTSGVQSLRIPRNVSGSTVLDYYYVEFRQPIGFDSSLSTSVTNAVIIRIAPNYNSSVRSKLVDTTANTTSFLDAPLALNKTFTDSYKAINITTLSASSSGAQVRVTFGILPCTEINPSLSISPSSQTGTPGQALNYQFTLTNNNTLSCSNATFNITAELPVGWSTSPAPLVSETLSPGTSVTRNVTIVSSEAAASGNNSFSLTAINATNSSLSGTATANYNVTIPDTIPPVVVITNPTNGSIISGSNITLSANASDAGGMAKVEFYVDGKLSGSDSSSPYSVKLNIRKLSKGSHSIQAKAYDKAGNIGVSSVVTVTK